MTIDYDPELIMDVGMHRGEDAAYYLAKGFRVVGFEADPDHVAQKAYGVRRKKSLYGRSFLGVERSTFLIDGSGILRAEWRGIKVAGHVDDVLKAVKSLKKAVPA